MSRGLPAGPGGAGRQAPVLRTVTGVVLLSCLLGVAGCSAQAPVSGAGDGGTTPPAAGTPSTTAGQPASPVSTTQPSTIPSSATPAPHPGKPRISKAGLAYFRAVALGAEYGGNDPVVRKWQKAVVTVRVAGSVSSASRTCLNQVITDFNALTATTDLRLTGAAEADITMHFAPVARFPELEPNYVPGNMGFFYDRWGTSGGMSSAVVLISTTEITSAARCHLIREELTQSMGLMRDTDQYPASVFYAPWTTTTRYAPIDEELVSLLYSGALTAGDTWASVVAAVTVV